MKKRSACFSDLSDLISAGKIVLLETRKKTFLFSFGFFGASS
jgi:hypothetical protein